MDAARWQDQADDLDRRDNHKGGDVVLFAKGFLTCFKNYLEVSNHPLVGILCIQAGTCTKSGWSHLPRGVPRRVWFGSCLNCLDSPK